MANQGLAQAPDIEYLPSNYGAVSVFAGRQVTRYQINLHNRSLAQMDVGPLPELAYTTGWAIQGGFRYVARRPRVTAFSLVLAYSQYRIDRVYESIPLNQGEYMAFRTYGWGETRIGLRVTRYLGYYSKVTLPVYVMASYSRLRRRLVLSTTLFGDGDRFRPSYINFFTHGFSGETGINLGVLHLGISCSYYPSVFAQGFHELHDGNFNRVSRNSQYAQFDESQPTSLIMWQVKAKFQLHILTFGSQFGGRNKWKLGAPQTFHYFWSSKPTKT